MNQYCLNCSCIWFRDLSKKSQNLNMYDCVCICACVFARVCMCTYICAYVYVCINDKWKQCYNCHMHNTVLRIYLRNVTKFQKLISWKFKEFVTNIYAVYLYLLKFCYISSSIKMLYALKQSWKSIFIGIFF